MSEQRRGKPTIIVLPSGRVRTLGRSMFTCPHRYPEGEYCPACGEVPYLDEGYEWDEDEADAV